MLLLDFFSKSSFCCCCSCCDTRTTRPGQAESNFWHSPASASSDSSQTQKFIPACFLRPNKSDFFQNSNAGPLKHPELQMQMQLALAW